jgi:hypothetical protein
MEGPPEWTGALVIHGLSLYFAPQPRLGEQTGSLRFLVDRTRALLGPTSPEYVSLMLRTAPVPGVSVRQRCRERVGWFRSRSQLYWWSNKGAMRVAAALAADGVPVPDGITQKKCGRLAK